MPQRCSNSNGQCRRASSSRYRCLYRSILCFSLLLSLGLSGFVVGMVSYFAPPIEHSVSAHPLDYRIVPISQTECGELQLISVNGLLEVDLYILKQLPHTQLGAIFSEHSKFERMTNTQLQDFTYTFYLVEGSKVDIIVDLNTPNREVIVSVLLFDQNVTNKCSHNYALYSHECSFSNRDDPCNIPTPITVSKDSQYYISLCYNSADYSFWISSNSTAHVNKLIYEVDDKNTRSHCKAPCSEQIDYFGDSILMATSNATTNVTWEDTVKYKWLCSDIRAVGIWVSFVMLLGMFLVMLSVGFIVALCVVVCIRKQTESDESELLIPSDDHNPLGHPPPPQYTVASEDSLRSPPPYTEAPDTQTVKSEADK